jgi:NTP pyrophosphatase (non-canonical NTP hydrolase)
MDYNQYIKDATRTESLIDEAITSQKALAKALKIFIKSAQILDLFKREVFYKKDFSDDQIAVLLEEIHTLSTPNGATRGKDKIKVNPRILHASLGFATEAGEIIEALVESMEGKDFDTVNFMEELGDINWYQAIAMDETGLNLEDTLDKNINKLKARFPNKFSEERAIKRSLSTERGILEGS